jgi:hypothetical protein
LSIPIHEQGRQLERLGWAIRLSPLAVAAILAALWLAGASSPAPDLRLSAPSVARPGTTIGVRAWQVDEDDEGQTVIRAPAVVVELRNARGVVLASTKLVTSQAQGREGNLQIPRQIDERLWLVGRARVEGREVDVERSLYVSESIEPRLPKGRSVNAFQAYEIGPMRVLDSRRAPEWLDPRIEEGACVPELRCFLSVWVGDRETRVRVRPLTGVRVERSVSGPSRGFFRFPLVVLGHEGRIEVEALGEDGTVVAAREVRLPVVPGGIVARAWADEQRVGVEWEQLGGRRPVVVDVFQGGEWVDALSLSPDRPDLPAFRPGVWRLQVRTDLFSDDTAGVCYLVIPDPRGPSRARLAADAVLSEADREGLDPLALTIVEGGLAERNVDDAVRALFAVPSFDVISVGPAVGTRGSTDEALERKQDHRRWQAAASILLIGLIVSMILLRVEILAQARARQLLEALGDEGVPSVRRAAPGRGLWGLVLVVFVLLAVLALSKRWF